MKSIYKLPFLLACGLLLTACGVGTSSAGNDTPASSDTAGTTGVTESEAEAVTGPVDSNLLFEDTFDGAELNADKWERCPEWERHGSYCIWDDDMSYLDGEGHLVLRAEWDAENGRVKSGAVRTNGLFTAGYAYYEASIKFPIAPGTWGPSG